MFKNRETFWQTNANKRGWLCGGTKFQRNSGWHGGTGKIIIVLHHSLLGFLGVKTDHYDEYWTKSFKNYICLHFERLKTIWKRSTNSWVSGVCVSKEELNALRLCEYAPVMSYKLTTRFLFFGVMKSVLLICLYNLPALSLQWVRTSAYWLSSSDIITINLQNKCKPQSDHGQRYYQI